MTTNRATQMSTAETPVIDFAELEATASELTQVRKSKMADCFGTFVLNPSDANYRATLDAMTAYKSARQKQSNVAEMKHRLATDIALDQLRQKLMGVVPRTGGKIE